MAWNTTSDAVIWIFNVGRGSAAFVRTPFNKGILIDISRSEPFSTSKFILDNLYDKLSTQDEKRIAQAILTHPHTDHISDCEALASGSKLYPKLLTCPNDKIPAEAVNWSRIKNIDKDKSLAKYRALFEGRSAGLQTIEHDSPYIKPSEFEYGIYYLRPPICEKLHTVDNDYGNAISLVTYFRYGSQSILFPGDITPEAMAAILGEREGAEKRFTIFNQQFQSKNPRWSKETFNQPSLKSRLSTYGLSVLVAPHHGLESCHSTELHEAMKDGKPDLIVISEKYGPGVTEGKTHGNYQCKDGAKGLRIQMGNQLTAEPRYSISTKSNHILIRFSGTGAPRVICENRIEDLMKWANQ
ncbi:MAG TPA: hypothetical protein VFA99_06690 [Acidobacteriaceae bacterium]|nr:hypothetical protein [Acidobacteriaceae bacterium]